MPVERHGGDSEADDPPRDGGVGIRGRQAKPKPIRPGGACSRALSAPHRCHSRPRSRLARPIARASPLAGRLADSTMRRMTLDSFFPIVAHGSGRIMRGRQVDDRRPLNSQSIVVATNAGAGARAGETKQRPPICLRNVGGSNGVLLSHMSASPMPASRNLLPFASGSLSFLVTASTNMHNSPRRVASLDSFLPLGD